MQSASLSEPAGSTIRSMEEFKYTFLCMVRGVNDMELIYSHSNLSISLILGLIDFGLTLCFPSSFGVSEFFSGWDSLATLDPLPFGEKAYQ